MIDGHEITVGSMATEAQSIKRAIPQSMLGSQGSLKKTDPEKSLSVRFSILAPVMTIGFEHLLSGLGQQASYTNIHDEADHVRVRYHAAAPSYHVRLERSSGST